MSKSFEVNGKYWETIDEVVTDYMKTDDYQKKEGDTIYKNIAARWLAERLDKTAPMNSTQADSFTITENELYGLISIIEIREKCGDNIKELMRYLRNIQENKHGNSNI